VIFLKKTNFKKKKQKKPKWNLKNQKNLI